MTCPRCYDPKSNHNYEAIQLGDHWLCTNPNCRIELGCNDEGEMVYRKTQFEFITDIEKKFPYNQIFRNRSRSEFYRKPYLEITSAGSDSLGR